MMIRALILYRCVDNMMDCGFIYEWNDKHKVPLDDIITYALQCKSDLVYRLDLNDDIPRAVVGARTYNEAVATVKEFMVNWDDLFDPNTQSWTKPKLVMKIIKETLSPWEPPYKYNTEVTQKTHICPNCKHVFKERKKRI